MKVYIAMYTPDETNIITCLGAFSTLKNAEDALIKLYRAELEISYEMVMNSHFKDEEELKDLYRYKTATDIDILNEMNKNRYYKIIETTVNMMTYESIEAHC